MVSLKDLDAINARSDARIAEGQARIEAAINRNITWTICTALALGVFILAVLEL